MAYPEETREIAEELYIYEGLTLEQVSDRTQISMPTLKQWSSDRAWFQRKKEYQVASLEIKEKSMKLEQALLNDAIATLDPQKIYALSRLKSARGKETAKEVREPDIDRPKLFMEDMEFAVKILQEVDPQALKLFGKHFGLIVRRWKDEHSS